MQRMTLTLALTAITIVGGVALSSAVQSDKLPLVPEIKEEQESGIPYDPTPGPLHSPLAAELKGSGPPTHPENIVVINGTKLIAAGGVIVAHAVPSDRWLVLTDVEATWPSNGVAVLSERMGGLTTDKRVGFLDSGYHSSTGIAFQPGSQVLLREVSLGSSANVSYSFTGYLVKP